MERSIGKPTYQQDTFVLREIKNLVNKSNLVHNLFVVFLSISTCFGLLRAHHQEKQLCLCDIWYLFFCMDNCLVRSAYEAVIHTEQQVPNAA